MDIGFNLNEFRARVAKIEEDIEKIEQGSTVEKLGEIEDYDHLVTMEGSFWSQVEHITKLDDEVSVAISEIIALGGRKPEKRVKTLRELNGLSRQIGVAMAAVMGAIRRLSGRKNELYGELDRENEENYENYLNALPGDLDEGC